MAAEELAVKKSVVRVLFYGTSLTERWNALTKNSDWRSIGNDARQLISEEHEKAARFAVDVFSIIFKKLCVRMSVIQTALSLRTKESMSQVAGKTIIVFNADEQQVLQLVKEYQVPEGCENFRVLFVAGQADEDFRFATRLLRDTDKVAIEQNQEAANS